MDQGKLRKAANLPPQSPKLLMSAVSAQKTPGQLIPPGAKVIAFLSSKIDSCIEKIVYEMAPYWKAEGIFPLVVNEAKCREVLPYTPHKVILFRSATRQGTPDSVVVELGNFIPYLQQLGIRVTYYLDDFLIRMNREAPLFLMSKVDEIIVATNTLKDYISNCNVTVKPITVVKTHIDLPTIDGLPKSDLVPKEYYNILFTSEGRIGALTLYKILEYMNQHSEEYKDVNIISVTNGVAQIRSIINRFRNIKKTYYERVPLHEFYKMVKSVNLIISPGEVGDLDYMIPKEMQSTWLDSKSCVKYTLAGAVGIPCVVTKNMREYREAVRHGETGFIADSIEEWIKYIDLVRKDRELGEKIGKAARKDVEDKFNVTKRSLELLEVVNGESRIRVKDQRRVWLPPIAGGPRTFHDTLEKYLPLVSGGKMAVTGLLDKSVESAIVVAFIGAKEVAKEKENNPKLKVISRVDGLPFKTEDGSVNLEQVKLMTDTITKADLIVWQSNFAKKAWEPYLQLDKKSIIIPNGVDLEIFKPEGEKFPLDVSKFNILHVNFSTFKHKRIDLLEDIIIGSIDNKSLHFTLMGQYVDTSIINDMEKWGVYPNVTYLGPMDQSKEGRKLLATVYRAANALLFTSNHEGCPNTVLEAIGCGLPVIYNDEVDIVPELLGDNCLPFNDCESFNSRVEHWDKHWNPIYIVENKNRLRLLAEKYSAEEMARKYMEILE